MKNLLKKIKKFTGTPQDKLLEVIPVNKVMTVTVIAPMYSNKKREITEYFDECRVVSINGKIKATLVCKSKQFADVVIYDETFKVLQ